MYKIIGADGKEYGPVSVDQLRQWIAEGRLNLQSKVLPDGATEWKTVAEIPELAAAVPAPSAAPTSIPGGFSTGGTANAADQVSGPAIGLMVTAGLGFVGQAASLVLNLAGSSFMATQSGGNEAFAQMFSGAVGAGFAGLGMLLAIIIFLGGLKMKQLKSYGFAMTASVIAMVPCVSPCCLVGLPVGIWAIVVLNKPEVKAAFN